MSWLSKLFVIDRMGINVGGASSLPPLFVGLSDPGGSSDRHDARFVGTP
jgi:hypothetical protein